MLRFFSLFFFFFLFLIIMQWSGEKTFLIWKFIHGNFVFRYSHIFAPALSFVLHGARRVYVCEFVSMESQQPTNYSHSSFPYNEWCCIRISNKSRHMIEKLFWKLLKCIFAFIKLSILLPFIQQHIHFSRRSLSTYTHTWWSRDACSEWMWDDKNEISICLSSSCLIYVKIYYPHKNSTFSTIVCKNVYTLHAAADPERRREKKRKTRRREEETL